jgi:hypothetical protein
MPEDFVPKLQRDRHTVPRMYNGDSHNVSHNLSPRECAILFIAKPPLAPPRAFFYRRERPHSIWRGTPRLQSGMRT